MIRISEIKLSLDFDFRTLCPLAAKLLNLDISQIKQATLYKKSIDARKKDAVLFTCTIDVEISGNEAEIIGNCTYKTEAVKAYRYTLPEVKRDKKRLRPILVGAGPAGLFAALTLAQAGCRPIIFERGKDVDSRAKDVEALQTGGVFNESSNIQFGEGGAGTFSDGKLNTGTKDERARMVLETFVRYGAPPEILYQAKPHIGTDILRIVVKKIREQIISLGGEVHFLSTVTAIHTQNGKIISVMVNNETEYPCDTVLLAIGHSARDTFLHLYDSGVPMEAKPFSVGVRIEHKQEFINKAQYGKFFDHPALGVADYKLAVHLPSGRGVYTFCVCPGGEVSAMSEPETVVTNGMSYYKRDKKNINSAVLVGVTPEDFGTHPLAGIKFQREIEKKAYQATGSYRAPAQLLGDFFKGHPSRRFGAIAPSYKPGVVFCNLQSVLPDFIVEPLRTGIKLMDNKIRGFANPDAVLTAPETRSSSPVRILRDEQHRSSLNGLYPCGEGSGYAGGIMSAAVDGIKTAEAVLIQN